MNKLDEKYLYSHCTSPIKVMVQNPVTHIREERLLPCGKCLHCKSTRVSEWITRMTLNSMFVKYVYYVTLTYDVEALFKVPNGLEDVNAILGDINMKHKVQMLPLTLCKRHTQLFWKRLRKHIDFPIQYYLVGEYGHRYGRPHYHAIIWSDEPLTEDLVQSNWCYGHIDFQDLKCNQNKTGQSANACYRYVCKYLFKDFKFEDIPTLSLHKINYETIVADKKRDGSDLEYSFEKYIKDYRPFMLCSRKNAIGCRYLQKFLSEFREGHLRLFGIQEKNLLFPRYFVRKSKESCCPFKAVSIRSRKPLSAGSTWQVYTYVVKLCDTIKKFQDFTELHKMDRESIGVRNCLDRCRDRVYNQYFDFYDCNARIWYLLDNDSNNYILCRYNKHTRNYDAVGYRSVFDVARDLKDTYEVLMKNIVEPFETSRLFNEMQFKDYLDTYFDGSRDKFNARLAEIEALNKIKRDNLQARYLVTKNLF